MHNECFTVCISSEGLVPEWEDRQVNYNYTQNDKGYYIFVYDLWKNTQGSNLYHSGFCGQNKLEITFELGFDLSKKSHKTRDFPHSVGKETDTDARKHCILWQCKTREGNQQDYRHQTLKSLQGFCDKGLLTSPEGISKDMA